MVINEGVDPAVWGERVSDAALAEVAVHLSAPLPMAWANYLRRDRWLQRGWLESGEYVQLYGPDESLEFARAWQPAAGLHPGFFVLGGDGGRDIICVDLRQREHEVMYTDIASGGWADCEPLGLSVDGFIRAIDDGSFDPLNAGSK